MFPFAALFLASSVAPAPAPAPGTSSTIPGPVRLETPLPGAEHPCITPEEYARIERSRAALPAPSDADRGAGLVRYRFHPQAGILHRDLQVTNYLDLDTDFFQIGDHRCSAISYDGHLGHDVVVRSFAEQEIGVPVFAVEDGTVLFADDGHPDMNTQALGQPSNFVIVGHGAGHETWYFHLKNGSVAVAPGAPVTAGQQIGLTASSGNSTYPHLHFETHVNGVAREPHSGACNPIPSLWTDQPNWDSNVVAFEAGLTPINVSTAPQPPTPLPRTNQVSLTQDGNVYFWVFLHGMPAFSTWQINVIRANGASGLATGVVNFNNPSFYAFSIWYWQLHVSHFAPNLGTAHVQLRINGQQVVDIPMEVVQVRDPMFNRPPNPITAAIVPAGAVVGRPPVPHDVLVCEVDAERILADPDGDIVRFEYVWTIDDVEVRAVTSAAYSDMLPANMATPGQVIRCAVTLSDGNGGVRVADIAETTMRSDCPGDATGERVVNFEDLNIVVSEFNRAVFETGLRGDLNQDGFVDFADLNEVVSFFNVTCD